MKNISAFAVIPALLWANFALAQGAPAKIGPDSLKPGASASNIGTDQVSPMDERYGAKCDGITVDSAAFTSAITPNLIISLPAAKTCIVADLVITDGKTLDCNNSILRAASGAHWIVKKQGYNSHIRNCVIYDPNSYAMKTTTLNGDVAPGALTFLAADASQFQLNMITTIQLVSGVYWPTKIWNVSGNTVTFADPIPSTILGTPTVNAGGSGYVDGTLCVAQGGIGPPMTGTITANAGAVTGFTPRAPGLYQTPPSSPIGIVCPATINAFGALLNVTWGGAMSGAFADAAFGAIIVDNANGGGTEHVNVAGSPVGIQVMNSGGASYNTTLEDFNGINIVNAQMVGFAKFAKVNNIKLRGVVTNGIAHHASSYGVAGLYIDGDWDVSNHCGAANTGACGGSKYDILTLSYENGVWDYFGQLDTFIHATLDTTRDYGLACIGCNSSSWEELWTTFTGNGQGSQGVGAYFGSGAVNNQIAALYTQGNGTDLHLGDNVSAVWVPQTWGPSKKMTGNSAALYPGYRLFSVPTLSISSLTSPVYIAPGIASATQGPSAIPGLVGNLTTFWATTGAAPSGQTYQIFVYLNKWNGSAYSGWAAYGSCIFTGSTPGCLYAGPAIPIGSVDQVEFVATVVGGGSFPANQTINIVANGI